MTNTKPSTPNPFLIIFPKSPLKVINVSNWISPTPFTATWSHRKSREKIVLFFIRFMKFWRKNRALPFRSRRKLYMINSLSLIFRISFFPLTNLPIPNGNWKIRNFFRKMRRIWSSMGLIFIFQILTKLSICLHLIRVETWPGTAGFRSLMKLFTMN